MYQLKYFVLLTLFSSIFGQDEYMEKSNLIDCKHKIYFNPIEKQEFLPFSNFIPISSIKSNFLCDDETVLGTNIFYRGSANFVILLSDEPRNYKKGDTAYEIYVGIYTNAAEIRVRPNTYSNMRRVNNFIGTSFRKDLFAPIEIKLFKGI
uniref:Reelin domain-containing protein n=1 Tax=Megaselia scalaris TaxID=36166 RepID=T1GLA1_MEGSC